MRVAAAWLLLLSAAAGFLTTREKSHRYQT
jgi:hypothetical protein